jgi:hypothetical protein
VTKSGRSGTAGRIGPGERDGKAYERNRRLRPLHVWPALTRWIWAGKRRVPDGLRLGWSGNSREVLDCWLGGHGEGLRRSRGDVAGVQPGADPVDRRSVNVGTVHVAFRW